MPTDTLRRLVDDVPARYRALVILGAGTGVRIGEAMGLTVDRVDFLRRSVTIDRQLVGEDVDGPVWGPVKDRKNRPRTIPLPEIVADNFAAHLHQWPAPESGIIFTGEDGAPLRRSTWSNVWRLAADPLGIPVGNGYHQLRHFYASTLIAQGASVKVVQARLGQTSAAMTLDVYSHLWPDSDDSTRIAVDAVLGQALVSSSCHEDGDAL